MNLFQLTLLLINIFKCDSFGFKRFHTSSLVDTSSFKLYNSRSTIGCAIKCTIGGGVYFVTEPAPNGIWCYVSTSEQEPSTTGAVGSTQNVYKVFPKTVAVAIGSPLIYTNRPVGQRASLRSRFVKSGTITAFEMCTVKAGASLLIRIYSLSRKNQCSSFEVKAERVVVTNQSGCGTYPLVQSDHVQVQKDQYLGFAWDDSHEIVVFYVEGDRSCLTSSTSTTGSFGELEQKTFLINAVFEYI